MNIDHDPIRPETTASLMPSPRRCDTFLVFQDGRGAKHGPEFARGCHIRCRECIREADSSARFEDDDRLDWEIREPLCYTEAALYPDNLDPERDFIGTLYYRADHGSVCEWHGTPDGCMGDALDDAVEHDAEVKAARREGAA